MHAPSTDACFHGGAFFDAIGETFTDLSRRHDVINADVLDAWFPPAPAVVEAVQSHLAWALRTSPPTHAQGLVQALAATRHVPPASLLLGGGSSDLIYLALLHWLDAYSRVLILDPMYGEYAHVLEQVVGCTVDRVPLEDDRQLGLDLAVIESMLTRPYDLVILVNPNSPTGHHVARDDMLRIVARASACRRIWIDETYVEYAGGMAQSLESIAAEHPRLVVCKSMSKVYALSGARVAYLCASADTLASLRPLSPPWSVGLIGQIAAVAALQSPDYYAARYAETHTLRRALAESLTRTLGWTVLPGVANFLLCKLPHDGIDAATCMARCREHDLFVRDVGNMGARGGMWRTHTLRVAVKDAATNARMLEILQTVNREAQPPLRA